MPAVDYIKHLVECHCVLPQFKHTDPPRWHRFVVFSEVDDKGEILPSFAQCNNCGVVHKVTEIGVSSVLKRDNLPSLPVIEELRTGLPPKLVEVLEKYQCTLPTYQEVTFIMEHQLWGRVVLLSKEEMDGFLVGKQLQIIGDSLWRVTGFQDELEEP